MSIKRIQKSSGINRLNTKFKKIKRPETKKSTKSVVKMIIYIILFFIITWFILLVTFYHKYLWWLSVEELKNYEIPQSSIIYDKNWKELYQFYKEKRTYVDYEEISKNIVNWLVAWEDKRFWENPWVDIIWLVRAWLSSILWWEKIAWTSTLTQQLTRNTLIIKKPKETFTEWIDRKIKEIFLSYSLTKTISKEKILELYLNKIEFWHNAFGIEEATKTFFGKSAKDASILEWSILASLPKWPTYYSPYNHQDRLVWYISLKTKEENEETWKTKEVTKKLISKEEVDSESTMVNSLKSKFSKLKWKEIEWSNQYIICWVEKSSISGKYSVDNDWCIVLDYSKITDFISYIEISDWEKEIFYYPWRKDYILSRMLEDKYITFEDFKKAIIDSIWMTFNKSKDGIVAPHFVFYVKEYLEKKYDAEPLRSKWLHIYTTLDLDLQKKAEEIVKNQAEKNASKFNAKNSALISIDNKTGWILAMVWNEDYFSDNGKWNVNVITSKLQPGSSFKPFVYSLAMLKNQIWTRTPVYDVETTFPGDYKPKNFDGRFMGKISVSTALNYSRNIPAIKMYYLAGWANDIIDFMHKLWATSLEKSNKYWASLSLWTGEMTPLDLAKSYSVFANMWEKNEISPILKIIDSKWNIIEDNTKKETKKENIMTPGQAFLINNILSDSESRPGNWNSYLEIWRQAAVKTWTSTKPVKENWKIIQYPANLWTAWYTPQITTIVWSGNITWETMKYSWSWLEGAAPIWRDFMKYAHKWLESQRWEKPNDVKNVKISELSWYLPNPENENNNFLVSSYFINPPKKIDGSKFLEYDELCYWKVTPETPKAAIKKYAILELHSLKPELTYWEGPVQAWIKSSNLLEKYWLENNIPTIKDEVCKRENGGWNIGVNSSLNPLVSYSTWANPINIAFVSSSPITKVEILINWESTQNINISDKVLGWLSQNIYIDPKFDKQKITVEIRAINSELYSGSEVKEIYVWIKVPENEKNKTPTNLKSLNTWTTENSKNEEWIKNLDIKITNPKNSSIKINTEDYFNLRFTVSPKENLSNVNILVDDKIYKTLGNGWDYVIPVNQTEKLSKWVSNLKIQAISSNGAVKEKMLQIEVL